MPEINITNTSEHQLYEELLEFVKKAEVRPVTVSFDESEIVRAKSECQKYLNNEIKNIVNLLPLSVYYILSQLDAEKQIEFIKNNLSYLKNHDQDIFFYNMQSPKELSYYFSYETLKNIYIIDIDLFNKIMNGTYEYIFHKFKPEDYLDFMDYFEEYINEQPNSFFINFLHAHDNVYSGMTLPELLEKLKDDYTWENNFINKASNQFRNKIDSFSPNELFSYSKLIHDSAKYQQFVIKYQDKLSKALSSLSDYELSDYLENDRQFKKHEIIFNYFLDDIITNHDIKKILPTVNIKIIIKLYKENREIFKDMTLIDWVQLYDEQHASYISYNDYKKENNIFELYKKIFNDYEITISPELFDLEFYRSYISFKHIEALKYIELKYREQLNDVSYTKIDATKTIFSNEYFNNLTYLWENIKAKKITKLSIEYKETLALFIQYLENKLDILCTDESFKVIENYFYKIVKGNAIANIFTIECIEEMALINRLGTKIFDPSSFSIEQINHFNVKEFRKIIEKFDNGKWSYRYQQYILKLILLVGVNNTKRILAVDDDLTTLEHILDNVEIKYIKVDNHGNSYLNQQIMNLLFNNGNFSKVENALINKDSDLYKYLPRIFNEWKYIELNGKNKSLNSIIEFLKSDTITLEPNYYRIEGLFKYIGCSNNIVKETLKMHDQILKRTMSTIPKVSGSVGEYTYEILDMHDMEGLAVGSETDCCFTVLGRSFSSLKHATLSKNGRILVVRKDGKLMAHSWIWRNGNLLCLDNIEISKSINSCSFLNVYLDFANKVVQVTNQEEGIDGIQNVTIGYTNFDKIILGIQKYPCLISNNCDLRYKDFESKLGNNKIFVKELPQPLETVDYSDSKNVQYLILGNGNFHLKQNSKLYEDERKDILYYDSSISCPDSYEDNILKIVNSLRYVKYFQENNQDDYKSLSIYQVKSIICNDDWYIITYTNGDKEEFICSEDSRAYQELEESHEKLLIR